MMTNHENHEVDALVTNHAHEVDGDIVMNHENHEVVGAWTSPKTPEVDGTLTN